MALYLFMILLLTGQDFFCQSRKEKALKHLEWSDPLTAGS
jgi:hypothetical protein